jgi:1-acyl-sn-glycerol-3-phosphate acyltransferase
VNLLARVSGAGDKPGWDGLALDCRDPDYIRAWMPVAEFFSRYYFRVRLQGVHNIPATDPVIFVGNHSGGLSTPDTAMAAHAFWTHCGPDRAVYALVDPGIFKIKPLDRHIMKVGGLAATPRMAERVLEAGRSILIYPGAGDEAYRSYGNRNVIDLRDRSAYIRLAIRHRAPIVPVVCAGGHETLVVLDDGEALATALGLDRLGVTRLPLTYSWPHGLAYGVHHNLPFPARLDLAIGQPITLTGFTRAMGRDRDIVRTCHQHVESRMQAMMDALVEARAEDRQRRSSADD